MPRGRMQTEIPPGRDRHARLFQQTLREVIAVGRQLAGIGIQVERTFRRDRDMEAKRTQCRQKIVAPYAELIAPPAEFTTMSPM